jgi:hypothetical protein
MTIERSIEIIQNYVLSDRISERIYCSNLINDLFKAVVGLKNIQETYRDDKMFVCNIDILIENVDAKSKDYDDVKDKFRPGHADYTYEAKYGSKPDSLGALGYDAAMVAIEAIKRTGSVDGATLRDAIAQTKDHPGIAGSITLDSARNAVKPAVILQVKDDSAFYVATVNP